MSTEEKPLNPVIERAATGVVDVLDHILLLSLTERDKSLLKNALGNLALAASVDALQEMSK